MTFAQTLIDADAIMAEGPEVVQPSAFWAELNAKHSLRLSSSGIGNFKRTLAKDYFTWMRVLPWDSQIRFLLRNLPLLASMRAAIGTFRPCRHPYIPLAEGWALNFLTRLVWQHAEQNAPELLKLEEPGAGNPPDIRLGGKLVSQDLANSILEYQGFKEVCRGTVIELGGGYGRNAFVALSLNPSVRYIMVDISPAIGVAQEYLTSVFPDRRHFTLRHFERFDDVRSELESSHICYLLPHQLALIPDGYADLFINISSLHEMLIDQVRYYLKMIKRLVRTGGHFYLKAWKVSNNPQANFAINATDYDLADWDKVYWRTSAIQTRFFETLLRRNPTKDQTEPAAYGAKGALQDHKHEHGECPLSTQD